MSESGQFSITEVAKHNSEKDCWIIIHNVVYDVTSFIEEHPGGRDILIQLAGKDATVDFESVGHSKGNLKGFTNDFYFHFYFRCARAAGLF